MSRLWVRAYISETQLAQVRLNQNADVHVDGVPDTLQGRLSFISPSAEFTPKVVETRELRVDLVYRVKVDVQDPKGLLKIGMPVDVRLHTPPS
jgi:HlyD family secretion protein